MSIRFDAAADRLTYTGSIPVPTSGLTITAWVKIVNDQNTNATWFRVYTSAFSTVITSATDADGTGGNNYFTGGGTVANVQQLGVGSWCAVAVSHDTGTTGKAYVRIGVTTTATSGTVSSATPDGICLGGRDSTDPNEWFDGEMAQVRIWSTELNQTQIEAEWASPTPVVTSGLYANWPLANATDLTDTAASRVLTTPNGTGQTTGADDPPNAATTVAPRPPVMAPGLAAIQAAW